jgi:hypothetical protein
MCGVPRDFLYFFFGAPWGVDEKIIRWVFLDLQVVMPIVVILESEEGRGYGVITEQLRYLIHLNPTVLIPIACFIPVYGSSPVMRTNSAEYSPDITLAKPFIHG